MNYSIQKNLKLINGLISKNYLKIPIFYNFGKIDDNNLSNYITYYDITDQSILYADNISYVKKQVIQISIFTQERNFLLEEELEQILENNKIIFKKIQNYYLNSEKIYITIYEVYLINTRN